MSRNDDLQMLWMLRERKTRDEGFRLLMDIYKQRIVFNMRYYDELSYKEMGEILNSSENALKTNYHYATEKIKAYLKEEDT